ncbi:MAG: PQQ-binding-like beta-propeller repeat protein, partial [Chthoniobacteraceae bacterium]
PTQWSEEENVKWKMKIPGFGTSTPIILGDQVFVLTAIEGEAAVPKAEAVPAAQVAPEPEGNDRRERRRRGGGGRSEQPATPQKFTVLSVDKNTGKTLWQTVVREEVPHEGHHRDHGYASGSPVTDGEHLFASFGSRGIYCLELGGKVIWEKDLGDMQTRNGFGEGTSPALHGETLIVNWDHEGEDFVVALNKRDGREVWRKTRDEATSWATPLIVEHDGKAQVIISATNRIRSYDLATGEEIWECAGMTGNVIPTPIYSEGILYITSGFRGASFMAIKLGAAGDLTDTDAVLWKHTKNTPYVPSPLLHKGRLYFFSGNTGTLSILEAATGKPLVEAQRIEDLLGGVYASPVAVDDRIYLVGRDGKTVVIKAGDQVEQLATNKLDDKFDASAAIVGNQLFLRGHQNLYCISE